MKSRFQQILTIFLLLLFPLENVANAAIESCAGGYSEVTTWSTDKDSFNFLSWILEENESEEKDDDKVFHGSPAPAFLHSYTPVSYLASKAHSPGFESPVSMAGQHKLKLICRLTL